MKQLLTILFVLLLKPILAQDTIVMKNGTKVRSIILKELPEEIIYKYFDEPDDPTSYHISKTDVLIIKYQNGTKEIIQVRPKEVIPDTSDYKRKAKSK